MKNVLLSALVLMILSVPAFAAERSGTASCTVESTGEQGVSRKAHDSVQWSASHEGAASYEFTYADGSQGQFSLMSIAGEAGAEADEFVSISGHGRDECKEERLFAEGAKDDSEAVGIETVCPNGSRHSLTVTCSF